MNLKKVITITVAGTLAAAIIAACTFSIYGKYSGKFPVISEEARTAAYVIDLVGEDEKTLNIKGQEHKDSYEFKVINYDDKGNVSEVDQQYDLVLDMSKQLPAQIKVSMDGLQGQSVDGITYRFTSPENYLKNGPSEKRHTLEFEEISDFTGTYKSGDMKLYAIGRQCD